MTHNDWSLESYLEEARVASRPIDDEQSALEAALDGDINARRRVIESYLYRAAEAGLRLAPTHLPRTDAVQEANLVLLRLVEKGMSPEAHLESAMRDHFENL